MAVSHALRRLLHIRDLQEEQSRLALESALGELHSLEHAMATTFERGRRGRRLIDVSVQNGQLADRLAGIEETRSASRHAEALEPRIDATGEEVRELRKEFLSRRVERRQAETLIRKTEAREAVEDGRRGQQTLDNWYSSRMHSGGADAESPAPTVVEYVTQATAASEPATEEDECASKKT
jgi:flagellar biosynthesis chaperone FliJ